MWERRAPFTPEDIQEMICQYPVDFQVQPSPIRSFSDDEYRAAGAHVQEDLTDSTIIFAIKEIPLELFEEGKTYVFFSHTIKGQYYNMPLLQKMMELKCTLIDYEKICDENGCRLIAFGRYAGIVGMIESLWALGRRLTWEKIDTPFTLIPHAYTTHGLNELKHIMAEVATRIRDEGLPAPLSPFICGFTGYGNVSNGAQEIFDILPVTEIPPEEISLVFEDPSPTTVYKVVFREKDMVEPCQSGYPFDLQDYYSHPENYRSQFDLYLPFLTVLMNCILWNPRYPRVVTRKSIKILPQPSGSRRLRVIGDISCDLEGSIEFNKKVTEPDNPVYVYNPSNNTVTDGYRGDGVVVMAIDNLPCELPRESSMEFSHVLKGFIPGFLDSDFSQEFPRCGLPLPLKKAVILYKGDLTPDYQYLTKYLGEKK